MVPLTESSLTVLLDRLERLCVFVVPFLPTANKAFEFESMGVKCPEARRQIMRVYVLISRPAVSLSHK